MLRLRGFRARHFTRTLSYCKRRGGWCASQPHGIVGAPLLFLPGVLWCALFKRAHVTVAASFKVRLPWICISQRLTGCAICRPEKRQCSQINWQHFPSPCSFSEKKKKTIRMPRKRKLFLFKYRVSTPECLAFGFEPELVQGRHTSQPSLEVQ